jgi:hypothetical protein
MTELRSTTPDQTPTYYDSPEADLESLLKGLPPQKQVTKAVAVALPEAMRLVLDGKVLPADLYKQLPLSLKALIDKIANQTWEKPFQQLKLDEQRQILQSLIEVTNRPTDTPVLPRGALKIGAGGRDSARRWRSSHVFMMAFVPLSALGVIAFRGYMNSDVAASNRPQSAVSIVDTEQFLSSTEESSAGKEIDATNKKANSVQSKPQSPPTTQTNGQTTGQQGQRTWIDINGRQVEATLVGYRLGQVALKTADGSVRETSIVKLSENDRVWLWDLATANQGDIRLFETRLWTSAKDAKEVLAAVIEFDGDEALMMRSDGRCFKASPEFFSVTDQSYLSSAVEAK